MSRSKRSKAVVVYLFKKLVKNAFFEEKNQKLTKRLKTISDTGKRFYT